MCFANAKFAKVLRRTAYPVAVAVLGPDPFFAGRANGR